MSKFIEWAAKTIISITFVVVLIVCMPIAIICGIANDRSRRNKG